MLLVWLALLSVVAAHPLPQIVLVPDAAVAEFAEAERLKRDPLGFNARGFHDDIFGQDFGVFHTVKRSRSQEEPAVVDYVTDGNIHNRFRRDITNEFKTEGEMKRRPEMGSSGFHGDTFSGGFGEFWTMKKKEAVKRDPEIVEPVEYSDIWSEKRDGKQKITAPFDEKPQHKAELDNFALAVGLSLPSDLPAAKVSNVEKLMSPFIHKDMMPKAGADSSFSKRRPDMDSSGFHGDTFSGGFGDFWTMKRNMYAKANPFEILNHQGVGKGKRRPEMGASGFHGDTFSNGFGDFWTMKRSLHDEVLLKKILNLPGFQKRRPEMGASGYHGDTFSNGFGEFWTMKKKKNSSRGNSVTGDIFAMKRRPEMDSGGFHGDTFSGGFGDFWPMKKSGQPELLVEPVDKEAAPEGEFSTIVGDFDGNGANNVKDAAHNSAL